MTHFSIVSSIFGILVVISTYYEQHFDNQQYRKQMEMSKHLKKTHMDFEDTRPVKHTSNSTGNGQNGQNFELQQISVENNNDIKMNSSLQNGVICQAKGLTKTNGEKIKLEMEKLKAGAKERSS